MVVLKQRSQTLLLTPIKLVDKLQMLDNELLMRAAGLETTVLAHYLNITVGLWYHPSGTRMYYKTGWANHFRLRNTIYGVLHNVTTIISSLFVDNLNSFLNVLNYNSDQILNSAPLRN